MSRLLLQVATVIMALIPIATGIITLRGVKDPLYRPLALPSAPILDSNLRFFGGVWLGGAPPKPFIGITLLELVGAPLFIYWQYRVASALGTF